jgi:hypothetical protein
MYLINGMPLEDIFSGRGPCLRTDLGAMGTMVLNLQYIASIGR